MIAPQTGHDLTPVSREEVTRLRDLHMMCSEANLREVKKYLVHFPHLFQVADVVGNTALHYAAMSQRSDFVEEVLEIYRDCRTFLHFSVEFKRPEDLEGLAFSQGSAHSAADFVVPKVKRHGRAGILVGDGLYAVSVKLSMDRARRDPKVRDVVQAVEKGEVKGFPLIFKFRRPALVGIFAQDTWHHVEAVAKETRQHPDVLREGLKILRLLRKEKETLAQQSRRVPEALQLKESTSAPMLPPLPVLSSSSPRVSKKIPRSDSHIFTATNRGFSKCNSVPMMSWSNKAVDRANWSLPR